MQTKFKIIETADYVLAVSDEEIKEGWKGYAFKEDVKSKVFKHFYTTNPWYNDAKIIIAYQSKGNSPELDLPLLPDMVVEDDVEKLALESHKFNHKSINELSYRLGFEEGYKAATKTFSEEDLRKAIELSRVTYQDKSFGKTMFKYKPGEVIQLTKDSKTPLWFVAEIENKVKPDGVKELMKHEFYQKFPEELPNCVFEDILKTTTINNKTYLVGTYLNE